MSSSGVFGPAPDGVDLSATQDLAIRTAVILLMVIATIAVTLRVVARTMQDGISLALDDYCVILGLLFAHGTAICSLVSLPYGGGKHLWVLTAGEFTTIWQILFAYVMIYACAVTFTKVSIVLFYGRIFGMNWGLWFCLVMAVIYGFVVILTINVGCQPLSYFWTQYTTAGAVGHCMNVRLFFLANGIWAMLVDVCILITPIPIIYQLKMPRSQKTVVYLILLLGSFVCIASIIRIRTTHEVITSTDLTWAMGQLFIWSCCEPYIGIVCACLPTFAPFFRRWWRVLRTRGDSSEGTDGMDSRNKPRTGRFSRAKQNLTDVSISLSPRDASRWSQGKEWEKIHSERNPRLRTDDEMELTIEVTGPDSFRLRGSEDRKSILDSDIRVQKDVSWSSRRPTLE